VRPERCVKEGSGSRQLSIGAPLGDLEWGSFTGDFERQLEGSGNGACPSMSILLRERGGGPPLWGIPKEM